MEARVQALLKETPQAGQLTLYVSDVARGEAYGHREDVPAYLSSTLKVLVALEVLRQVDAGEVALSDVRVFGPRDVRDGVGPIRDSAPGTRFTVEQLLELMLVRSDNAAADLLIGLVGVERLEAHLRERGVRFAGPVLSLLEERRHIYGALDARARQLTPRQVLQLSEHDALGPRARALAAMLGRPAAAAFGWRDLERGFDAFYASNANSAPMRQMGRLLEQAARCDGLSPASCARLTALMRACHTGKNRLRAGFPAELAWGHKTGTQHRRACDVGVLELEPGRPVVVAACLQGFTRVADAERVMAGVGRALTELLRAEPGSRADASPLPPVGAPAGSR
jgi:beta-lactamase class A